MPCQCTRCSSFCSGNNNGQGKGQGHHPALARAWRILALSVPLAYLGQVTCAYVAPCVHLIKAKLAVWQVGLWVATVATHSDDCGSLLYRETTRSGPRGPKAPPDAV
jgi:hypothetical protein